MEKRISEYQVRPENKETRRITWKEHWREFPGGPVIVTPLSLPRSQIQSTKITQTVQCSQNGKVFFFFLKKKKDTEANLKRFPFAIMS